MDRSFSISTAGGSRECTLRGTVPSRLAGRARGSCSGRTREGTSWRAPRRRYSPSSSSWGREIVKDTDDIEGDRQCRATTLPIVSGRRAALTAALAIFLVALCISIPVPLFVGMYGTAYALVMLLSVVPILLISIGIILKGRSLGAVSTLLKIGMFFGCVAFHFGPRG